MMLVSISSVSASSLFDGNDMDNELSVMNGTDFINDDAVFSDFESDSNSLGDAEDNSRDDDSNSLGDAEDNSLDDTNSSDGDVDDSSDDSNSSDGDGDDSLDDVNSSDENSTEPIIKNSTIINHNTKYVYGESFVVQLIDEDGIPISNRSICFVFESGKNKYSSNGVTDEDGYVFLNLNYGKGIYNITASFDGDEEYYPSNLVVDGATLIEKIKCVLSKYSAFRGDTINIGLKSNAGYYLPNTQFTFIVNGVTYNLKTDSKGIYWNFNLPNKSLANISCIYGGSTFYTPVNASYSVPVYVKTTLSNNHLIIFKGDTLGLTLKDKWGNLLKDKKVTFTICGKTYTRTTNSKGMAYLKINLARGFYDVTISYAGNSYFYKSSKKFEIYVVDPSGQFQYGLNQNNAIYSKYYNIAKGKCKATTAIKNLVAQLTKGYTSQLDKAGIIFNYINRNIDYDYYANSKYTAANTLKRKAGNCCDLATLVVSMSRAAGLSARYVHSKKCTFTKSGKVSGHVWAQVKINGKWYSADATSLKNGLGHIENFNVKTFKKPYVYAYLPF